MRRACTLALAPLLTLAFLTMGSGSANAFGSEVLGCYVNSASWTANSCAGGDTDTFTGPFVIHFTPHNLSGTYSYQWTVANITAACSTGADPCIYSGCTSTSSSCAIQVAQAGRRDKTFTVTLVLTQSGQSRTLQAQGVIYGWFI